jgi:glutamate racemase
MSQVRAFAEAIASFLLGQGAKLIVVACNTASAAALHALRETYPEVPFVGMEPAVKPAAESTRTKVVGVLATPATFQGALFASVVERFAEGVRVIPQTLPGLVERIEAGDLEGPQTQAIVSRGVGSLLARGIDTLVLACTHYPFVIPLISKACGGRARVIDPSPAIARQTARLLKEHHLASPPGGSGVVRLYTSGDPRRLRAMARRLAGIEAPATQVQWLDNRWVKAKGAPGPDCRGAPPA